MLKSVKQLGPGLLFAGAAIGVSHLVQSTRAGADFGFGLLWVMLMVHAFKYPFFQYGPRYALATKESLLDGYKRLGRPVLIAYFLLTITTMFTIQTAVTIVTASLASSLFLKFEMFHCFGLVFTSIKIWAIIILLACTLILFIGKYKLLDRLMKFIILILSISTIVAVLSSSISTTAIFGWKQVFPANNHWVFLIAFMGWMPAPLDLSIWHSIWSLEKAKSDKNYVTASGVFDFNVGYITTLLLGIGFLSLGALVMFNNGTLLSTNAGQFANQLIAMYTQTLGKGAYIIIAVAAFTAMFSTTLTTLDASPRVMELTTTLLHINNSKTTYGLWLVVLLIGTIAIFFFLSSELGTLIRIATILSFLTAPFYAIFNYKLITSNHVPKQWRPTFVMHILSVSGIIFLIGFGIWFLTIL